MAWHDNVRVDALGQSTNTPMHGPGSTALGVNSMIITKNSVINMAILCAHAKGAGRNVNARVEDDRLKEIYVW